MGPPMVSSFSRQLPRSQNVSPQASSARKPSGCSGSGLTVNGQVNESRLGGNVEVPYIVMHRLEMPGYLAAAGLESDHGAGIVILVSFAITTVIVG